MDSDSASDIADDIVGRILKKRQKSNALVPDITSPPKDGQMTGKKNHIQRTSTVLKQDSNTDPANANRRTKVRFTVDIQLNSSKDPQKVLILFDPEICIKRWFPKTDQLDEHSTSL